MRIIAAILADLRITPLGTESRLEHQIDGACVLARTVRRIAAVDGVDAIYVSCPQGQQKRCAAILQGTPAVVRPLQAEPPPWAGLVHSARKWSLDGWRGGIGGATYFDEFVDARILGGLLRDDPADAVLCAPPAAPLFDTALAQRMAAHHREQKDSSRMTFTQAVPGLAGIILDASLVHELAEKHIPVGWVFTFKPDTPQRDLIFQPCCCETPREIRHATGRLLVDTRRAAERVATLLSQHREPDLPTIGRWLRDHDDSHVEPLPREVEIELTTEDPFPDALLRPRGRRVPARGPIDLDVVHRIMEELTQYDDALVVLGGFGDPVRHPRFGDVLHAVGAPGQGRPRPFGLAVRTSGADLSDEHIEALIRCEVDILNVVLDAWTPQLYGQLQSPDDPAPADLNDVLHRLDRLAEARQRHKSVRPIVVPEMTKARDNLHELDEFHDGWLRRVGALVVTGYSHFAGQCEDRSVMPMAPRPRTACRRLRSRCTVLADGSVAICDQDFKALHVVGNVTAQALEQAWHSAGLKRLREAHRKGRFEMNSLCAACEEWHRP